MKKIALFLSLTLLVSAVSCDSRSSEQSGVSAGNLTSSQEHESAEKTTLTLALAGMPNWWTGWQTLTDKIDKFNKKSDEYFIDVKIYDLDEDDVFGDTSVQRMNMDILSGKVPDIISASPVQLDKFRKNGYLTDLSQLMESGNGMKREDFLESVINSVDIDGEINVIYPAFSINTAVAKTELVGADLENWSIQQAIDAYASFDGDFLSMMYTKYDIRHYFFKGMMVSCVDLEHHTCDFGRGLAPVLDFLTGLPPMEKRFDADPSEIGKIADNTALVKELSISGINEYYSGEILRNFQHEPFTFVGYPTDNGSGTYTDINSAFGIMSNSSHKNEAWEVLSQLVFSTSFQTEISDYHYGVPVSKKAVENLLELSEYNGRSINADITLPDGSTMKLTEEQKQQFVDFLDNLVIDPFVNTAMEQIIKQESDYVFEGERSIDECVNNLQNRFELYLSETA